MIIWHSHKKKVMCYSDSNRAKYISREGMEIAGFHQRSLRPLWLTRTKRFSSFGKLHFFSCKYSKNHIRTQNIQGQAEQVRNRFLFFRGFRSVTIGRNVVLLIHTNVMVYGKHISSENPNKYKSKEIYTNNFCQKFLTQLNREFWPSKVE